ncbi:hypothetical protein GCM10011491_26630 [Brucella endophytica]|uniref:Uncharacterized protein n=1 Tax=Brucella endophytica TaxID=1963359 RepID=A0A916WGF0_9HYPH|nr:hypothetical protein GCM10011491_26630 [Brucella endophytica]
MAAMGATLAVKARMASLFRPNREERAAALALSPREERAGRKEAAREASAWAAMGERPLLPPSTFPLLWAVARGGATMAAAGVALRKTRFQAQAAVGADPLTFRKVDRRISPLKLHR